MMSVLGFGRTNLFKVGLVAACMAALLALVAGSSVAAGGDTTRVSVNSAGNQADIDSGDPSISADGRYVAFTSGATNLVAGDTNSRPDIFVRDRQTNTTERVSIDTAGNQADSSSFEPSISPDGRYVAFASSATNLVADDNNDGTEDVFVRDRQTNTTERVSINTAGNQADDDSFNPSISPDGRYVAFYSSASTLVAGDTNGERDIFVRDRQTNTTERVSINTAGNQADSSSFNPSISADGRYVAFDSHATNLVAGDTNGRRDIFVHERGLKVVYDFGNGSGGSFGQPIRDTELNQLAAGAAVPVKFGLGADYGLNIFAEGYPKSTPIDCPGLPTAVVGEASTVSKSGLTYDAASGIYTYVWKTDKAWKGTCRELNVKLADGTNHPVKFQFK
jgi:Tol biopolymer transport system component